MQTKTKNNYKVSGKKMSSRFGLSHREVRMTNKWWATDFGEGPDRGPHKPPMSKRLAKKCKHKRWHDDGYGGPEGGCEAGYCKDCGYSFHHTLY